MKKFLLKIALIAILLVIVISLGGDLFAPLFSKYGDADVVQSQITTYLLLIAVACVFFFILKTLLSFVILGVILLVLFYLFQSGVFKFISF